MDNWAQENFLKEEPPWYPNTERVRNQLERYQQVFLQRVKAWAKTEKAMAPHSSTLAWKIPWMEEPGGLQSMGSLRARHD